MMKKRKTEQWYFALAKLPAFLMNSFFDIWVGGNKRPVVYDIDNLCPELRIFETHFDQVQKEFLEVYREPSSLPSYNQVDHNAEYIANSVDKEKQWKVFMLYAMGLKPEENRTKCPITTKCSESIPNLFQVFFSVLEPGKSVPAHCGPFRGYIRYHLGIKVPQYNPPKIRIHDHFHTWEEGKSILFDDSWDHEVINRSDDYRAVLIVDIKRPLPFLPNLINRGIEKLVKHTYGKQLMNNLSKVS